MMFDDSYPPEQYHPKPSGSRRLAIRDKIRDYPSAEETRTRSVRSRASQEFGPKEGTPDAGSVDPEEIFSAIFGGERFVPIIGHILLGKDMKDALQNGERQHRQVNHSVQREIKGREIISPEQRARREEKRRRKEERGRQANAATWSQICEIEANELKGANYGVELSNPVGCVYLAKVRHYLATNWTFVGGAVMFSETVFTPLDKQVFDRIAEAEKSGMSPEEKKSKLWKRCELDLSHPLSPYNPRIYSHRIIQIQLLKGAKLETETVLRGDVRPSASARGPDSPIE
ncbi:unnamed protein product [Rhizoctonia solani]|uniref:Uncharacterized protein n=1 Tax=Rhizoctonia solani TaxID=456999 RepID=A0A8H3A9N6_9AGAM|nr:unnamed protein product [Rhizoctonia solani]